MQFAAEDNLSKAFIVSERDCDPATKRIKKIIFSLILFIAHAKTLDLIDQVVL